MVVQQVLQELPVLDGVACAGGVVYTLHRSCACIPLLGVGGCTPWSSVCTSGYTILLRDRAPHHG